jgi:hypothetical protein
LPQQKTMPGILRKLKATAAALDPEQLKRMRGCITFKAGGFQAPLEQGIFDTVLRALLEREELTFGYVSLTRRRENTRGTRRCEISGVGNAMAGESGGASSAAVAPALLGVCVVLYLRGTTSEGISGRLRWGGCRMWN